MPLQIFLREHRRAGRDPADHRQLEQASGAAAGPRVARVVSARGLPREEPEAISIAPFLSSAAVLLGGIHRAKAHALAISRASADSPTPR